MVGQTGFFNPGIAICLREEKLCIKPSWTPLKNWPYVTSCPYLGSKLLHISIFFIYLNASVGSKILFFIIITIMKCLASFLLFVPSKKSSQNEMSKLPPIYGGILVNKA